MWRSQGVFLGALPVFLKLGPAVAQTNITISPAAQAACQAILVAGVETLTSEANYLYPEYIYAQSHYWSAANADLIPACAVFPTTAQQVSQIVTVLNESPGVGFSVKSGGHNPNVGFSSTDGGVLISMQNISSTVLSTDQTKAYVGTGSRWVAVAEALEPYNLTVVSGRIGDVGVGGLTLGGGLSFLSTQYGLVCDNVVNYEVVLANASIVNANAKTNTDLFWALKGGGNQFGIVTTFTFKTYPIDLVWAGIRTYWGNQSDAILDATADFTANLSSSPKAAVIVTGEIAIDSLLEIFVIFFFYDGPVVPDGVFDKFNAIPTITDGTEVQTYASFLNNNDETNLYGLRYLIRGTTLPNLPGATGRGLYKGHYAQWKEYVMTSGILFPGFIFSLAFQPMPAVIPALSQAAGGNALGMSPISGDHIWMEYDISWLTALGDDPAHAMAINITETVDAWAESTYAGIEPTHYGGPKAGETLEKEEYTPIFMNDAMYDQLPAESYENNGYKKLKAIQKEVDPDGFFPSRTGGFKYT